MPRALRATENKKAGEEDRGGKWLCHILFYLFIFNNSGPLTLFLKLINLFINLFIFGSVGSLLLHTGFL